MKKLFYSIAFVSIMFIALPSSAQVSVQINVNSQPQWGPAGYDYVRYYYMPEYDIYYDVAQGNYIYWHKKGWVQKSKLPKQYRHLDFYRTYKVVVNDVHPWNRHQHYRGKYKSFASNRGQVNIYDYNKRHKKESVRPHNSGKRGVGSSSRSGNPGKKNNGKGNNRPAHASKR